MAKSRDLFKKIRDAQGTFHAKTGLKKEVKAKQKRRDTPI